MGTRRFIDEQATAALPNFLREWREYRGLKQQDVEREFGWPGSRVSNLENRRATITEHVLTALARLYDCEPSDLIGRPPPEPAEAGGFAGLRDALASLSRLAAEAQAIRGDINQRLDALESDLVGASGKIEEALREGADLIQFLQRAATAFAGAIHAGDKNGDNGGNSPDAEPGKRSAG